MSLAGSVVIVTGVFERHRRMFVPRPYSPP